MDRAESERTMDSVISGSKYGFCIIFKSTIIILASVHFHCASTRVSPKEKRGTGTQKDQNEQKNYLIDKSRSQSWNEPR